MAETAEHQEENIMFGEGSTPQDHTVSIKDIASPKQLAEKSDYRTVRVPSHRYTPLRNSWEKIVATIVENLTLDIRMNTKRRLVELRTNKDTPDLLNIQRASDFLKSFMLGFDLNDSIAMLRLDDLYLESFEIKDGNSYFNYLHMTVSNSISEASAWRASIKSYWTCFGRERKD